ncbi:MAG TPA: putative lipid II flippase FtsW [Pyrinomonadaceae bacterium]|jgi:cell division protein FtsW
MARKLQADKWLFAATAGLALFGIVMVYSASAMLAAQENGSQYYYVKKQAMWTFFGFVAMLGAMHFDYQLLRNRWIIYGLLSATILMLVAVFAFPRINGAHRWIKFAGFSLQPSEVSKLALTIFLAYFFEKRAGEEGAFLKTFVPAMAVTGLLAVLVVAEPDLGTAMMLMVVSVVIAYTAGTRLLHLGMAAAPALVGLIGLLIFVPWRLQRMITFLNPWADPQDKGFQVVQSLIAIGSGGVNGLGFAQGKQKMFFLPFAHSDFIFAVVGEELGLFGALMVVIVFGIFLWRGLRAALLAPDRFGMLLGLGIVAGIVTQALFNISVVLSLVPTKGIPLPFISYGGSSLVPTLVSVGILLNISQYAGSNSVAGLTAPEQADSARATVAKAAAPRSSAVAWKQGARS